MTEAAEILKAAPEQVRAAPSAVQVHNELQALLARANAVTVSNADEYKAAVAICQTIAAKVSWADEERLKITRPMEAAIENVRGFWRRTFTDPLKAVDGVIRGKLRAYDAEQARLAAERQKAAEAEARRKREEAERQARAAREEAERRAAAQRAEAQRQREAAEKAQRDAEEARKRGEAEAAAAAAAQAEAAAKAASKAEQKAETIETRAEEKAVTLEQHAASVVAPVIESGPVKVQGKADRRVWKYEIVDPSKIDRRYLMPDEQKIARQVKATQKESEDIVGGIRVWDEADISIRKAKP